MSKHICRVFENSNLPTICEARAEYCSCQNLPEPAGSTQHGRAWEGLRSSELAICLFSHHLSELLTSFLIFHRDAAFEFWWLFLILLVTQSVNPGTSPPGNIALFTSSKLVFHLCFHSRTPTIQILGLPMPTLSYTVFFLLFTAVSLQIHCQSITSSGSFLFRCHISVVIMGNLSFWRSIIYLSVCLPITYNLYLSSTHYLLLNQLLFTLSICLSINTPFIIYP